MTDPPPSDTFPSEPAPTDASAEPTAVEDAARDLDGLQGVDEQDMAALEAMAEAPSKVAPPPAGISDELRSMIEIVHGIGLTEPGLSLLHRRGLLALDTHAPLDVTVDRVDADGVGAEWVVAAGADAHRAIVHLHGGAYTGGGLGSHRGFLSWLSRAARCPVLSVDYRLAPEHPYPAGLHDARTAYRWLTAEGAMDPSSIALTGDSAGGGLAAALLAGLRDEGQPLPACAALVSPWTDLALTGASHREMDGRDPLCSTDVLAQSAAAYVPDGMAHDDPRVSPLYADLAGLPPLLVHVGEIEVLRDDSVRFVEAARAAGVDAELLVAPGMIHIWHAFAGLVPESDRDLATLGRWVRAHQRPGPSFDPNSSEPTAPDPTSSEPTDLMETS